MIETPTTVNCTSLVKDIIFGTGFGIIWVNQRAPGDKIFLGQFQQRCMDMHVQESLCELKNSNRCRTYSVIEET